MSASSGSRRETAAGSFSGCPDFVRERCVACLRATIQTKDQAKDNEGSLETVATHMRRNIDLAARTSALVRESEQRSS